MENTKIMCAVMLDTKVRAQEGQLVAIGGDGGVGGVFDLSSKQPRKNNAAKRKWACARDYIYTHPTSHATLPNQPPNPHQT
jgi:hypothetical protein